MSLGFGLWYGKHVVECSTKRAPFKNLQATVPCGVDVKCWRSPVFVGGRYLKVRCHVWARSRICDLKDATFCVSPMRWLVIGTRRP